VEELAGDGGGESDFRYQQQGVLTESEDSFDTAQVDFGLTRAGDALEEKGFELRLLESGFDVMKSRLLEDVEKRARAFVTGGRTDTGDFEFNEFAFDKSTGRLTRFLDFGCQFTEVMAARVKFEEGKEFALGLFEFDGVFGAAKEFGFEAFSGSAHGVAVLFLFFGDDPRALDQAAEESAGVGDFCSKLGAGARAFFEQREEAERGVAFRTNHELTGDLAAGFGERVLNGPACFSSQRQHAFEHLAQRGAVIVGDPASKVDQFAVEDGLFVGEA
jgi:hypothetical protein